MKHMKMYRRRGATLIEGMVAFAVFSTGILGVMQMNVLASGQNGLARRQSTATVLARDLVDAFERIPYTHDAFSSPSTLATSSVSFLDFDNTDGRRLLKTAMTGRPLMGSAAAIMRADGSTSTSQMENVYEVGWRVSEEKDASGSALAKHIVVMVRFKTPAGTKKQINLWTVKYNPVNIVGPAGNFEEI